MDKDNQIKKLDRQLKNKLASEKSLQENIDAKIEELENSKSGLKLILKVINEHKHLILGDIIEHVNLFEQQSNVYELLRIILKMLFKKLNKQVVEEKVVLVNNSQNHGSVTIAATTPALNHNNG